VEGSLPLVGSVGWPWPMFPTGRLGGAPADSIAACGSWFGARVAYGPFEPEAGPHLASTFQKAIDGASEQRAEWQDGTVPLHSRAGQDGGEWEIGVGDAPLVPQDSQVELAEERASGNALSQGGRAAT
jgi:hypothetical protein